MPYHADARGNPVLERCRNGSGEALPVHYATKSPRETVFCMLFDWDRVEPPARAAPREPVPRSVRLGGRAERA